MKLTIILAFSAALMATAIGGDMIPPAGSVWRGAQMKTAIGLMKTAGITELKSGNKTVALDSITSIAPDKVSFRTKSGLGSINLADLDGETRRRLEFDADGAKVHQDEQNEAIARAEEAARDAAADEEARITASVLKADKEKADAEFDKQLNKRAIYVKVDGFQNSSLGLLGDITEGKIVGYGEKPGTFADTEPIYKWRAAGTGIVRGFGTATVRSGIGLDQILWSGKVWPIGITTYTTIQGIDRTVPLYTADPEDARDYYRR